MKPIPKRLLPNSIQYEEWLKNDGNKPVFANPVTLKYVKVDEQKQLKVTSDGKEVVGNALLFYDYVNSEGLIKKPVPESKITFEDRVYKIVDTDILRSDSNVPHHFEVLLK